MVSESFKEFQKMWENSIKMQMKFIESFMAALDSLTKFNLMQNNIAVFRAKVQSGGRISIPEADRSVLNIKEGDVVKVVIIKEGGENGV